MLNMHDHHLRYFWILGQCLTTAVTYQLVGGQVHQALCYCSTLGWVSYEFPLFVANHQLWPCQTFILLNQGNLQAKRLNEKPDATLNSIHLNQMWYFIPVSQHSVDSHRKESRVHGHLRPRCESTYQN